MPKEEGEGTYLSLWVVHLGLVRVHLGIENLQMLTLVTCQIFSLNSVYTHVKLILMTLHNKLMGHRIRTLTYCIFPEKNTNFSKF